MGKTNFWLRLIIIVLCSLIWQRALVFMGATYYYATSLILGVVVITKVFFSKLD